MRTRAAPHPSLETANPPFPLPQLERYLAFFHGATTRVFNVGDYRRRASASASAAAAAAAAPAEAPAGLDASGGPGPGPGADADAVPAAGPSGLHLLSSRPPSAGASAFFDQLDSASNATRLGFAQLAMADMKAFLFPQGEEPRPPGGGPGPGRGSGSSAAGWSAGAPVEPSPLSGLRAVDSGRVAIFDATNSTRARRAWLRAQARLAGARTTINPIAHPATHAPVRPLAAPSWRGCR